MGKFQKGQPKPASSGRKKGVANKKTLLAREILNGLGVEPIQELLALMPSLPKAKRVEVWLSILPYCYGRITPQTPKDEADLRQSNQVPILTAEESFRELYQVHRILKELDDAKFKIEDIKFVG
ncbi:MAG: hypothetical protein ACXVB4_15595 [Pseudobdellovibrionaceae bacterium]